jgi:hypothetical protein
MRGRENEDPETDRWERKDWWGIYLEAPDPHALLGFWSAILDKPIYGEDDDGGALDFREGVAYLAVQRAEVYEPPVWPPEPGRPGMQLHLDVQVSDLEVAVEHASSWARRWRSSSRRTTSGSCSTPPGIRSACTRDGTGPGRLVHHAGWMNRHLASGVHLAGRGLDHSA